MKHKKRGAALITAAVLALIALFGMTACPNAAGGSGSGSGGGGTPPTPKHAITFSVDGGNGTLKAKADGVLETEASPITVEEGKTVTFTAKANDGYRVKGWTLDGNAINGTNNSYSFTVTKPATVKVSFESNSTPSTQYAVNFSVEGGHGTLKARRTELRKRRQAP